MYPGRGVIYGRHVVRSGMEVQRMVLSRVWLLCDVAERRHGCLR